ncbi:MAG: hypothetical protein QOI12_1765 [Alphaproteobacteria bacterium]|jgi:hypothetical protein|nr:hypothetical protein [Alphaproteobacteria bacterium]
MSVKLNRPSYEHAQKLIKDRRCVLDQRSDWTDHRPARHAETTFIEQHGIAEYAKWHLGEDDEISERNKRRYKFPYGDFENVHRCAVLAAESRAGQYKYTDIELACAHLHGMLEEAMAVQHPEAKEHEHVPPRLAATK